MAGEGRGSAGGGRGDAEGREGGAAVVENLGVSVRKRFIAESALFRVSISSICPTLRCFSCLMRLCPVVYPYLAIILGALALTVRSIELEAFPVERFTP